MIEFRSPAHLPVPNKTFSHGVAVPSDYRWLLTSGQVARRADGSVPTSIQEQLEQVWANLKSILDDNGFAMSDVVKINTFLTPSVDIAAVQSVRDRWLGTHKPTGTLLVVHALARPDLLVEIEFVAAKAP